MGAMAQPRAKILVVDDDPDMVLSLQLTLATGPYEVVSARSGEEGLRKIKEENPDLLILDVMMEDFVTGFKMVERLRDPDPHSEYAAYAHLPILLLTSIHQRTAFRFAPDPERLPVQGFLEKPIAPQVLLQRVAELLAGTG
jgi:CheY-like chemotaxis protein